MFSRTLKILLLLLFLVCFVTICRSDELEILLKLKTSLRTSNSNNNLLDSWTSNTSPCNFTGISCNNLAVTQIDLASRGLSGTLPLDSLCSLPSLEKLDVGSNFLYGPVSPDLNNCTKLTHLDLSINSFTGPMPDFSSLIGLTFLNLNGSGFSASFPWNSLQHLTDLHFLSLGDNHFDPTTQFPLEILNLKKLNWLYLANCSLEGIIPAGIGNLTELTNLELSDNNLSGDIPPVIGNLNKLWQLELYNNSFGGRLPVGLRNLTNLKNFDASMNNLEGDLSELKFLTNLVSLQLFENQLSGEIPEEFGDFKFLVNLSLYTNKLTGSLPPKLGSWAEFNFIDVSENFFTGQIPAEMCSKGKMKALLMLQNKFTGGIPANYANCSSMGRFRVNNNSLSGHVPAGIWGLPNLDFIDLSMNMFQGPITADIANARSLTQLHLQMNKFSGELPSEIAKASSLVLIDVSSNQFSGQIPADIGELNRLNSLYLQGNMFSGEIPASISSSSFLNNLNLAGNSLSGRIPSSLGSLPSLNSLNLSENQLSGQIPASLSSLKLSLLDLSNNHLAGRIPQSLEAYKGSFAGNPNLCSLNLQYFRPCFSDSGMSKHLRTLIFCLLVGTTILLVSLACFIMSKKKLACFIMSKKKKKDQQRSLKSDSWDVKSFSILSFTEDEILDSIKQENLIGKGGSGSVYRAVLENGNELAVKHIWKSDLGGTKKSSRSSATMLMKRSGNMPEFEAEVETLSSIRHVNVVKLYCSITSEDSSLLVYEYLPNGSLWDRLHSTTSMYMCKNIDEKMGKMLDWETRYEIALGAAKGLEYLHHGCGKPVIHRDVKSSNILLDEFFKPRIADFGLAKIVQANVAAISVAGDKDSSYVITGTHGYIAPEYAYTSKVNEKSDVYSFGVVLMELVTGKRPIEPEFGDNKDIVYWISTRMISRETIMQVVDPSIPEALQEDAIKVLRVGVLCTARLPALRPSMRSVVQMLEDAEPCKFIKISVSKDNVTKEVECGQKL